MAKAIKAFKKALQDEFQQRYFITNAAIVIIGSLLSLIAVIPYLYSHGETSIAMIILAVISYLVTDFLFKTKPNQWINFKNFSSVFSIAVAIYILAQFISWQALNSHLLGFALVTILAIINACFFHLLRRPTALGKKVILQAKGFELFLKASEKDQLEFRNPPQKTPQLFEKYLPYALALGLGQAWSSQFSKTLLSKQYQPQWYNGSMSDFTPDTFSTNLSDSLTSSISSSSVAPGSSSGFSGGSSGGGGGGGGGGGW